MACSACTLFCSNLDFGSTLITSFANGLYKTPYVIGWRTGTENQRNVEARWIWRGRLTDSIGNSNSLIITAGNQSSMTSVIRANKTWPCFLSSAMTFMSISHLPWLLSNWNDKRMDASCLLIAHRAMIEIIANVI